MFNTEENEKPDNKTTNAFFQRTAWTDLQDAGIVVGVTALALSELCHPVVPPLLFAATMVLQRDPALVRSCFTAATDQISYLMPKGKI